jgi:hypothetical protein
MVRPVQGLGTSLTGGILSRVGPATAGLDSRGLKRVTC